MMVDSVLKELGRAEAGLASRNRFLSKLICLQLYLLVVPFFFSSPPGGSTSRLLVCVGTCGKLVWEHVHKFKESDKFFHSLCPIQNIA